jgi:hypothetical protein
VQCDQPSTATASQLTYTGTGATFNGQPLVNPGGNKPIYFADPNAPGAGTASLATFVPAGQPLTSGSPLNILAPNGYPVRNDNSSSPAYVGKGDGTSDPELYLAYSSQTPSDTGTPIQPGTTTVIKSKASGLYCRLAEVPASLLGGRSHSLVLSLRRRAAPVSVRAFAQLPTAAQAGSRPSMGMVCDQTTPDTATPFTYTGALSAAEHLFRGCCDTDLASQPAS